MVTMQSQSGRDMVVLSFSFSSGPCGGATHLQVVLPSSIDLV